MFVTRNRGRWYVVVSLDGRKLWRTIVDEHGTTYRGTSEKEARRLAEPVEARLLATAAQRRPAGAGGSLKDIAPQFLAAKRREGKAELTLEMIAHHIASALAIFGEETHVAEIDYSAVERFVKARQEGLPMMDLGNGRLRRRPSAGAMTLRKEMSSLRQMLSYATARNLRGPVPAFPKVRVPKENRRNVWTVLSPDQAHELIADLREHEKELVWSWVQLAVNTGMRRAEIWKATWDWVKFDEPACIVVPAWAAKDAEERTIPLNDGALDALRVRGGGGEGAIWGRHTPYTALRRSCARLGFPRMRIHDLRHTAGTLWLAAGATPAEVRDLLGHCDLSMVSRYVHSLEQGRIAAVRRASIGGSPKGPKVVPIQARPSTTTAS